MLNLGYPFLRRIFPPSHTSSFLPAHLIPFASQLLQALLSTILASILFSISASPQIVECSLNAQWQQLFSERDASAIKAIQETLQCCGFRTPKDRSWPWDSNGGGRCADVLGYHEACGPKWISSSRAEAGKAGTVTIMVMLLQGLVLLIVRWRTERGRQPWSIVNSGSLGWGQNRSDPGFRPLLEDIEGERDDSESLHPDAEAPRDETEQPDRGSGLILPSQMNGAIWMGGTGEGGERDRNDDRERDRNHGGW
ncbi:tetraspanin tsp3 [Ceratocystis lukuohia]